MKGQEGVCKGQKGGRRVVRKGGGRLEDRRCERQRERDRQTEKEKERKRREIERVKRYF